MSKYKYSICMGCIHFDLYEKDNGKWFVDCKKERKLITASQKKQNCPDYQKWKDELPWWYATLGDYEGMKEWRKSLEDR